jgi:hypothetical protein
VFLFLAFVFLFSVIGVTFYVFLGHNTDIIRSEERKALHRNLNKEYKTSKTHQDEDIMCAVFEIRITQQKMVDAGIIKADEMSVCENKKCKNCYPQREVERINRSTQALTRGKRNVGGRWIDTPENVPDHAYPQICRDDIPGDFFYVNWTWSDREGRKMFFRSVHPRDSFSARPQRESKIELKTPLRRPTPPRGGGAVSPTKQTCECCYYDIESGMGYINTFVEKCQPCNMAEAGRRRTGSLGPS